MFDHDHKPAEGTKLGKAKAIETLVMDDGTRIFKKSKVRYWVERQGAREDFFIIHNEKTYHMPTLAFIRRFKVIIKSGQVRHAVPGAPQGDFDEYTDTDPDDCAEVDVDDS